MDADIESLIHALCMAAWDAGADPANTLAAKFGLQEIAEKIRAQPKQGKEGGEA